MKIVFMGTPEFAVPSLTALVDAGHVVLAAVSQPDKPRDRGGKLKPTPVKARAQELGIPVLQPHSLRNNPEFIKQLKALDPELIVVAAYGRILPLEVLALPRLGCINVHASLLPKFRGAAPIQRAVLEGEEWTGITLMQMSAGLDTGDILVSVKTAVDKKTGGSLHDELSEMGGELLAANLEAIGAGKLRPTPQDDALATYAPMIYKEDGRVDFKEPAVTIERQIRGMDPWPGAFTLLGDRVMKLWGAQAREEESGKKPGTVLSVSDEGLLVATGRGSLLVTEIQMPGKKKMHISTYIKGNVIEMNQILG